MCPEYLPGITDEPTTYRDDYRPHKLSRAHVEKKRANENISEPRKTVRPIAESHDTFQKLDYESRLPFDALWRTKEIVGNSGKTLPSRSTPEVEPGEDYANRLKQTSKHYREKKLKNLKKMIYRRFRPKIELVSPAVDLNELKDPEARKFVVDFIYKTTVTQAAEEVWPDFKNITDKTSLSTDTIENRSDPVNYRSDYIFLIVSTAEFQKGVSFVSNRTNYVLLFLSILARQEVKLLLKYRTQIPLKVKLKPDIPASYKRAARRWDFLQDRTLVDPPKACPERSAIYRLVGELRIPRSSLRTCVTCVWML